MTRATAVPLAIGLLATLPAAAAPPAAPACISAIRIDHTEVPDDSTILFVMRDHSVYRAHVLDRCVGLSSDPRGFSYSPTDNNDQLCANLLTIRLNTAGIVCQLGAFTRVK